MTFDVAVVGAGPAGATAARRLAMAGVSVVLLEKERLPRYKTCGGGLVYRGRCALDIDISPAIEAEIFLVRLNMLDSGLKFDVRYDQPIVTMVMRDRFDMLLSDAAVKAGVVLKTGFAVQSADFLVDGIRLHGTGEPVCARCAIAADGANSHMARLAGWPPIRKLAPALECELEVDGDTHARFAGLARFDFDLPSNGYSWVFPKKHHLSVGVGLFGGRKGGNLHHALRSYLGQLGLAHASRENVHGYVVPLIPREKGFVQKRVFLVGDAAGLADPVSAEGISPAIRSGEMAASALIDAAMDVEAAAATYQQELVSEWLPELAAGRKLARLFYSSAAIRGWLMRQHGDRLAHAMGDVFMGERRYVDHVDAFFHKLRFWHRH